MMYIKALEKQNNTASHNSRFKEIIKIKAETSDIEMKKHHINSHIRKTGRSNSTSVSFRLLGVYIVSSRTIRRYRLNLSQKK